MSLLNVAYNAFDPNVLYLYAINPSFPQSLHGCKVVPSQHVHSCRLSLHQNLLLLCSISKAFDQNHYRRFWCGPYSSQDGFAAYSVSYKGEMTQFSATEAGTGAGHHVSKVSPNIPQLHVKKQVQE